MTQILPSLDPDLPELKKRLDEVAIPPSNAAPTANINDHRNFDPSLYIKETNVITKDQHVLIKLPSGTTKLAQMTPGTQVRLGKFGMFSVDDVLGHPYGLGFEITDNGVVKCDPLSMYNEIQDALDNEEDEAEAKEIEEERNLVRELLKTSSKDNSNLVDIGSKIQKLSTEDIEEMKKESYSLETGRRIIEQIITQHGNFDKKTKYSQVKYLKRKRQKYDRVFVIEYLLALVLIKHYLENKDLRKTVDISEESVALMLNLGNVHPGGRYVVVDEMLGLLVYSMLERMEGKGEIVVLTENLEANLSGLERYSNYPPVYINRMVKRLNFLRALLPVKETLANDEVVIFYQERVSEAKNGVTVGETTQQRKLHSYRALLEVLHSFKLGNFNGFLCVSTIDLVLLLKPLLDYIGGSSNVVIYSQFKELLVDLYHTIDGTPKLPLLGTAIHEIRARPYQAVPGKLHPAMTSRGGGGYILFGIRVFHLADVEAVGQGTKRRKKDK